MQEAIFFFDDSGVLHKNEPSGFFVYAGYVFTDRAQLDVAKRKYIHANKLIKEATKRYDELKAARLETKYKRSLFNSVKEYPMLSLVVDISKVYDHILSDKKSICRYKDYVLKRCIKQKLLDLIAEKILDPNESITITIYIDEQLTATNGYYSLRDSIMEELQYGIVNFDYGVRHSNVFNGNVSVYIHYCDSSKNYLIQASDILANRLWTSFRTNNPKLREIEGNTLLTFP